MKREPSAEAPDTLLIVSPRKMRPLLSTLAFISAIWPAAGCWKTTGDPIIPDGDADSDIDGDADSDPGGDADGDADGDGPPLARAVDLLVLVDNSNSMTQEQAALSGSFGLFVDLLTDPPDTNDNGVPDYRRVEDLHVGVISTDMGTGGYAVTTCEDAVDGDDGILLHTGNRNMADCEDQYPRFLEWRRGDDLAGLDRDFQCVGTLGTGGCGYEQQLKAVGKALRDHADGANEGFLRDDSLLAVMIVTDEEDCSIREDIRSANDIFNTQLQLGPLNLRCFNHRDKYVAAVEEYVDAILGLRPDPRRVVVTGILGIPPDSPCNLYDMRQADFQCLLDLAEMQEVVDNSAEGQGERLTPSCDVPGMGEAFPPRRIVDFVRQVAAAGGGGNVQSICQNDWTASMTAIAQSIGTRMQ